MPARSEAQRRYLNVHFGHAWVKEHGFDNRGKLPERVGGSVKKKGKKHFGTNVHHPHHPSHHAVHGHTGHKRPSHHRKRGK